MVGQPQSQDIISALFMYNLCRFQDAVAAAKAYDKAAVYLYGANAITNFGLEACLADPTEVGSCIVRAKEEAEHAAANRQAGSSSQGSAPAANASGSSHSPSSSMSSSSLHILGLDGLVAGVATQQWQQQQQQQQKYTLQESMQLLGAHVLPATAAAAVSGQSVSCALPTVTQPYHHQQQYPTAVTSTLSLDANSNSTATISAATADEDAAAAAGSNGDSLAAMNSADQACLLQLLLDAQQQQQQQVLGLYTHESLHSSPQPALVPGAAPTAAVAAAAACHQLFSQQPQVFQLTADNAIGAVYNPAASVGTAAAGRLLYAAEPAAYLGNLQQQQQYSLEQQIQLLSIGNHCAEQYHSIPCNDNFSTAAAAAAGSTSFIAGTRLGNITCTSATARGGSTYCSDAAAGCIPTCDWQYRPC